MCLRVLTLARTQQREVPGLLRQGREPDKRTVRAHAVSVITLMNYFPTLLAIVAPREPAVAWRARITDDMLRAGGPDAGGPGRPWWKGGKSPRLAAGIAIFFLFRLVNFAFQDTSQPQEGNPGQDFPRMEEFRQRERPPCPQEIFEDVPVTAERIEAIRRLIDYRPGKDVPPGEQAVEFEVLLDEDNTVLGMNKLKLPDDPAYAVAVEKAIRASGRFPPHTARVFRIGFHT